MLGKDLSAHIDTGEVSFMAEHRERSESEAVLSVRNVSLPGILDNVSFDVRPGEVLGIAGLVGSGRTELLRCLCGLERRSSGNLVVKGREVKWPRTVRAALKAGIAMIPEDRKFSGLIPCMSAADNITLSDLGGVARQGWISDRVLVRRARECAGAVHFDLNRIEGAARRLSGGNQQKLLVARWIHRPPLVLLADEPTRGVDVGAKETIAQSLRKLAVEQGMGLVLVSSVLEEVLAIADTVVVLSGGRMAARFDNRDRTVKEDEVLTAAFSAVSKCA
jgi:ABC-type sugar transport system ATPase subunit